MLLAFRLPQVENICPIANEIAVVRALTSLTGSYVFDIDIERNIPRSGIYYDYSR
jgi:hypothetical protein